MTTTVDFLTSNKIKWAGPPPDWKLVCTLRWTGLDGVIFLLLNTMESEGVLPIVKVLKDQALWGLLVFNVIV